MPQSRTQATTTTSPLRGPAGAGASAGGPGGLRRFWKRVRWFFGTEPQGAGFAMPIILFLVLVDVTLVLWRVERWDEDRVFGEKVQIIQKQMAARIERLLDAQVRPLRRLQRDWQLGRISSEDGFLLQSQSIVEAIPLVRTLGWVDSDGTCRAVASIGEDQALRGQDLRADNVWGQPLRRAQSSGQGAAGEILTNSTCGLNFVAVMPVVPTSSGTTGPAAASDTGGKATGAVIGRVQLEGMLDELLAGEPGDDLRLALYQDGRRALVATRGNGGARVEGWVWAAGPATPVRVLDRKWDLRVSPTPAFLEENLSRTSTWVLWMGLLLSVLISGGVLQSLRHRREDARQTRQHLAALESLNEVTAAISGKLGSGQELLDQLAQAAKQLLSMPMAEIALLDDAGKELEVVAVGGPVPDTVGKRRSLERTPACRQALESGHVLAAEDVAKARFHVNLDVTGETGVVAAMFIPLYVEGRPIGMLVVSDTKQRRFSDRDLRMAQLLGSQVAVTLANHRLYEQTHQALAVQKQLLEQRETLHTVSAAIAQAGTLERTLTRVVELAPQTLGIDLCVVGLTTENEGELFVAAASEPMHELLLGKRHRGEGRPAGHALAERRVVVVEDVAADPTVSPALRSIAPHGSILYIPLYRSDDKILGLLALVRYQAGRFSQEQLNMAELFASRTGASIENARLLHQMRVALEGQKRLLEQREMLFAVNAAVYQAGTLEESLRKIVQLAPAALGVDLCAVNLVTDKQDEVVVAAATEPFHHVLAGRRFATPGTNLEKVLRQRHAVPVEDAGNRSEMDPELRRVLRIGSIVYVPLVRGDNQPLGMLVLMCHLPRAFSQDQLDLSQIFSMRAAAAIENARLYEQTRRDAETKAMLLRELNHRVKNNLAGIVGLLSMGQPQLSAGVRQWLDRVIERVGTMARAQDLFSAGVEEVGLEDLVRQMLPSLSVVKPAGVTIRTELGEVQASLKTERAVSLAMVLHELCYNAIVHGLRGKGTVTVRARPVGQQRLAIDVIDDGCGLGAGADTGTGARDGSGSRSEAAARAGVGRSGIGLQLVGGLVGRELRGEFTLGAGPGGGTVATIEFPLDGEP